MEHTRKDFVTSLGEKQSFGAKWLVEPDPWLPEGEQKANPEKPRLHEQWQWRPLPALGWSWETMRKRDGLWYFMSTEIHSLLRWTACPIPSRHGSSQSDCDNEWRTFSFHHALLVLAKEQLHLPMKTVGCGGMEISEPGYGLGGDRLQVNTTGKQFLSIHSR